MSELKRALNEAADELANALHDEFARARELALDVNQVGRIAAEVAESIDLSDLASEFAPDDLVRRLDLSELAESINLEHLAGNLSLSDLATEIDLYDLAQKIDLSDLAGEVEVDPEDVASHLDVDDVASCIQVGDLVREIDTDDITTRLAGEIDLDNLAERVTDSVMDSSLPDLSKRVLDLQTQLSTIGDHLFILACNLRGDTTASWDATAATLGEAADQVPDNRVDGNGIRIADLEAVEDEIDDLAGIKDPLLDLLDD